MEIPHNGAVVAQRYQLGERIGSGGHGTVVRAVDTRSNRAVAIKFLTPTRGGYGATIQRRFEQEARILGALSHPAIVRTLDFGRTDDGLLYTVFELVDGRELAQILADEGSLQPKVAVHILRQVLGALAECHRRGITHRDIKPANLLIHTDGDDPWRVKLVDFGIAKVADRALSPATLTTQGVFLGTPQYMAPEQFLGDAITPASDVYSLGMVISECLLGNRFATEERLRQMERYHGVGRPTTLPTDCGLDDRVRRVVERMIDGDRSTRYPSAVEVARALRTSRSHKESTGSRSTRGRSPVIAGVAGMLSVVVVGVTIGIADTKPQRVTRGASPRPAIVEPVPTRVPDVSELVSTPPSQTAEHGVSDKSLGCGNATELFGHDTLTTTDASQRPIQVYLPESYDNRRAHPVVVLLHDTLDTPETFLKLSRFDRVADRDRFLIIAPTDDPPAFEPVWHDNGTSPAIDIITDAITRAGEAFCIDPSAVFVVGHGRGGRVVSKHACAGGPFRAAATTSFVSNNDCGKPTIPQLHIAGSRDPRNPLQGGRPCGRTSIRTPLAKVDEDRRKTHGCRGPAAEWGTPNAGICYTWQCDAALVSCQSDGGYNWPGGATPKTAAHRLWDRVSSSHEDCQGPAPQMRYAEVIWDFFASTY